MPNGLKAFIKHKTTDHGLKVEKTPDWKMQYTVQWPSENTAANDVDFVVLTYET